VAKCGFGRYLSVKFVLECVLFRNPEVATAGNVLL
ncbi:hypothetical protein pipiens_017312, partial [Culex pipiens pipiens]